MIPRCYTLGGSPIDTGAGLAAAPVALDKKKRSLHTTVPTPQRTNTAILTTSRVYDDVDSQTEGDLKRPRCSVPSGQVALVSPSLAAPLAVPLPNVLRDLDAIVINLDRRPDRMAGCAARLQAYCPWLRFSKFSACDGRQTVFSEAEVSNSWHTGRNVEYQMKRSIRKGWNDIDSYQVRELELSRGELGCSVSHIRAWRHCLERAGAAQRPMLVLEDDAAPTPEFTATLIRALAATPKDADVLYLGYSQAAAWRREISADVVEAEYVWTTVGYLVWPAAASRLLSRLPIDQPVDNWMATACADGHIKAYCVRPKIIRQADAWNVNSDVAHSDEHYWGPDSDIHHTDHLDTSEPLGNAAIIVESTGVTAAPIVPATTMMEGDARFLAGGSLVWDLDSEDSEESEGEP